MTFPRLNRCSHLSILTLSLPIKATVPTGCENCSQPDRSRWSSLHAAIASNHGTMTESATENATSSNASSTALSGIDACSPAMTNSHDASWLSCTMPLLSYGSNEMSTSPREKCSDDYPALLAPAGLPRSVDGHTDTETWVRPMRWAATAGCSIRTGLAQSIELFYH